MCIRDRDQPALNAAFKDARKNQALRHRHIARENPDPIEMCIRDSPLDNRLAVGAIDTDILGRFIEAQQKFLHADCTALLADKNQVASPLDVGPDDDDLPKQVSGSAGIFRLCLLYTSRCV